MSYFTIAKEAETRFEERKSIFIGNVKRVYTEDEAKQFIETIRKKYKDARHNVFAYIVGNKMEIQRYSDDGEPQGTAGIPALEVIKKNDVTDTAIVVTRYFGGILLGTGGLNRAYTKATSDAIKESGIVERVKGCTLYITINYDLLGKVQYICGERKWHIEDIQYTDKVKLKMFCELNRIDTIKSEIIEISSGKAVFDVCDEKYFFRQESRLFEKLLCKN